MDFAALLTDLTSAYSAPPQRVRASAASVPSAIDDIFGAVARPAKRRRDTAAASLGGARVDGAIDGGDAGAAAPLPALVVDSPRAGASSLSLRAGASSLSPRAGASSLSPRAGASSPRAGTGSLSLRSPSTALAPERSPLAVAAEEDLQSSTLAPALPRLLSAMLAGVPAETLAARLARPVALDLVRRADGGLAARERAHASRAARHACHGLRLDGGPPQHGLKPLGRRAALALSGAGLRSRSSPCAPASLPPALLARLHARWCAHAWEALEAALAAAGRGGGGALGDARAQPRLAQLRPRAPAPGASAPPPAPGASAPPPAPGAAPPPSPAALHTPAGLARALQGPARGLLRGALDLHFARLRLLRCAGAGARAGGRDARSFMSPGAVGLVIAQDARSLALQLEEAPAQGAAGGAGAGAAPRSPRVVRLPLRGSAFELLWPHRGATAAEAEAGGQGCLLTFELLGEALLAEGEGA